MLSPQHSRLIHPHLMSLYFIIQFQGRRIIFLSLVQIIRNETNSSLFPRVGFSSGGRCSAKLKPLLFFFILFPFFPGERARVRADKPVTISLQTEEQGAHLKQWHYWPTAIASQRFHERREREGAATAGGSGERSIKNLAYFQRKRGARQTRLSQSLSNCFLSKVLRATKNKWLMSKKKTKTGNVGCQNRLHGGEKSHFNFQKTYLHNSSITWNHYRLAFFDMFWFIF